MAPSARLTAVELSGDTQGKHGSLNPNLNPNLNLSCISEIKIKIKIKIRIKSGRMALIQWQWTPGEGTRPTEVCLPRPLRRRQGGFVGV